jgi:hypothetical protein
LEEYPEDKEGLVAYFEGELIKSGTWRSLKKGDKSPIVLKFGNTSKELHVNWGEVCRSCYSYSYLNGSEFSWNFRTSSWLDPPAYTISIRLEGMGSSNSRTRLLCRGQGDPISLVVTDSMEGLVELKDRPAPGGTDTALASEEVGGRTPDTPVINAEALLVI